MPVVNIRLTWEIRVETKEEMSADEVAENLLLTQCNDTEEDFEIVKDSLESVEEIE